MSMCLNINCCGIANNMYAKLVERYLFFLIVTTVMTFTLGCYALYASIFEKVDKNLHVNKTI